MTSASVSASAHQIDGEFNEILDLVRRNRIYRKVKNDLIDTLRKCKSKMDDAYSQSFEFGELLRETKRNIDNVNSVTELLRAIKAHKASRAVRVSGSEQPDQKPDRPSTSSEQQADNFPDTVSKEAGGRRRKVQKRPEEATARDIMILERYLVNVNNEIKELRAKELSLDEMDEVYARLTKLQTVGAKWSRWLEEARLSAKHDGESVQNPTKQVQLPSTSASSNQNQASSENNETTTQEQNAASKPSVSHAVHTRAIERPIRFSEIELSRAEHKFRMYDSENTGEARAELQIGRLEGVRKRRFRRALNWFNKYVRTSGDKNKRLPFEAPDFETTLARYSKICALSSNSQSGEPALVNSSAAMSGTSSNRHAVPPWLHDEALVFFTRARNAYIRRRRQDNLASLRSYWTNTTEEEDPALRDAELKAKLSAHARQAEERVEELVQRCSGLDNDPLKDTENAEAIRTFVDNTTCSQALAIEPNAPETSGDSPCETAAEQQSNSAASDLNSSDCVELLQSDADDAPMDVVSSDDQEDFAIVKVSSETVKVHVGLDSRRFPMSATSDDEDEDDGDGDGDGDDDEDHDHDCFANGRTNHNQLLALLTDGQSNGEENAIVISDDDD